MTKFWLVGVGVLAAAVAVATAETGDKSAEKPAVKAAKEVVASPAVPMTLTGTVEKMERKGKDGTPFMTWFELAGDDGVRAHLPKGKVEQFVGMKVKIEGAGVETTKKSKVTRKLETITLIEKVDAAPQAAK